MSSKAATLFTAVILGVASLGLSACNTFSGLGKDTSAVGHDVSRAADSSGHAITRNTGASPN